MRGTGRPDPPRQRLRRRRPLRPPVFSFPLSMPQRSFFNTLSKENACPRHSRFVPSLRV
jgi:hypothetical protein